MQARTLIYKLLVAGPLAFVAWVGIEGRFSGDAHQFTACSKKQHEAINQYRYPLKVANSLREKNLKEVDDLTLITVVALWRHDYRLGKLKPVTPVVYGESSREGIRSQIRCGLNRVLEVQMELVRRANSRGDDVKVVALLADALELTNILKYSDFSTVVASCIRQRSIVRHLAQRTPSLSVQARIASKNLFEETKQWRSRLDSLERHENALLVEYHGAKLDPLAIDAEPGTIVASARTIDESDSKFNCTRMEQVLARKSENQFQVDLNKWGDSFKNDVNPIKSINSSKSKEAISAPFASARPSAIRL